MRRMGGLGLRCGVRIKTNPPLILCVRKSAERSEEAKRHPAKQADAWPFCWMDVPVSALGHPLPVPPGHWPVVTDLRQAKRPSRRSKTHSVASSNALTPRCTNSICKISFGHLPAAWEFNRVWAVVTSQAGGWAAESPEFIRRFEPGAGPPVQW